MVENTQKWLKDWPKSKLGEWERWEYGKDRRGWTLDCGGMFHADVGPGPKGYVVTLNLHPIGRGDDPEALKRLAERQIVERVRHMLPAYRIVHARVVAAQKRKEG